MQSAKPTREGFERHIALLPGAPAVLRLQHRCRFCGHFRPAEEFVCGPVIGQCLTCLEWHRKAMDMLCGAIPPACTECDRAPLDARYFLHRKDGCYQLLCPDCSDRYVSQRSDQFANTPFGS